MARNPSISLTEHQQQFVESLVSSGRYHGVSEVVRAGLREISAEDLAEPVELERLRADVAKGLNDIEQGRVTDFDAETVIAKGKTRA